MPVPSHLASTVKRIQESPISDPPSPWFAAGSFAVGGLTDVGFARDTDLLLVVSSAGRGVFDCVNGARVARDDADGQWQDTIALEADGIGPLANERVRTAGVYGGGLCKITRDGWTAEDLVLDWPAHTLLLVQPGSWVLGDGFGKPAHCTKVAVESELRAWGFSPTGRSLVFASSDTLTCWRKEPST